MYSWVFIADNVPYTDINPYLVRVRVPFTVEE